ncbi:hypothetical protein JTB14_036039 [Gonioctena quinquepunctata]|nr:hypothetical protein JTB14_036039 [Gonioctena quinquepunctata]
MRRKLTPHKIESFISSHNWDIFQQSNDVEQLSETLMATLNFYVDDHFPLKAQPEDHLPHPVNFFNHRLEEMRNTPTSLEIISDASSMT